MKPKFALSARRSRRTARSVKRLLAAGSGAVSLAAPPALAAIVYSGPLDVTANNPGLGVYIKMANFATAFYYANLHAWTFAPFYQTGGAPAVYTHYEHDGVAPNALAYGTAVQDESFSRAVDDLSTLGISGFGSTPSYLGVVFKEGSDTYYGWLQISYDDTNHRVTIVDGAYNNTPDGAINAGQVPEPARAAWMGAMLAGSAAAWAARRKRALAKNA